jgi:hypothetical protein
MRRILFRISAGQSTLGGGWNLVGQAPEFVKLLFSINLTNDSDNETGRNRKQYDIPSPPYASRFILMRRLSRVIGSWM